MNLPVLLHLTLFFSSVGIISTAVSLQLLTQINLNLLPLSQREAALHRYAAHHVSSVLHIGAKLMCEAAVQVD